MDLKEPLSLKKLEAYPGHISSIERTNKKLQHKIMRFLRAEYECLV